jgi:hypothetical protein
MDFLSWGAQPAAAGGLGVFELGVMVSGSGSLVVAGPGGSRNLRNRQPLGVAYNYTPNSRSYAWWKAMHDLLL